MVSLKIQKTFRHLKKINGFTLIELVLVIVLLGILSAVALPRFVDLGKNARIAAINGLVGAFNESMNLIEVRLKSAKVLYQDPYMTLPIGPYSTVVEQGVTPCFLPYPEASYHSAFVLDQGYLYIDTNSGKPFSEALVATLDLPLADGVMFDMVIDSDSNFWYKLGNGFVLYYPFSSQRQVGGNFSNDMYFIPEGLVNWTTLELPACYAVYYDPAAPSGLGTPGTVSTVTTGC